MRPLLLFFLVMVSVTFMDAQSDHPGQPNRIVKNWATVQTGEFAGHFGAMGMFLILDGLNGSKDVSAGAAIFSSVVLGNLVGNYWLKRETNQSSDAFWQNVLFSAAPTVIYALSVRPEFDSSKNTLSNVRSQVGLLLVSLFVTPVFATLGNEIFNHPQKKQLSRTSKFVQPYLRTGLRDYRIGFRVQF